MQDRRKYYPSNLAEPLSVTTEKEIILDTTLNPEMIVSVNASFVTVIELNVGRMRKKITEIKIKLYASKQRVA